MDSQEWLKRDEQSLAGVLPRCSSIVASHGKGSYLWDVDGNRYLDFASGIAACSTGHCHDSVVEAIQKQAATLIHTSVTTHNTLNIQLAEKIGKLCPFFEESQVFFCNSGAEAVDGALKLARRVTGQSGVVAFQGAFHGRTVAATSLTTAKTKYRDGYTPHLPYVYTVPYGDRKHLDSLDEALEGSSPRYPYPVGAILVEPVLGEGGQIVPSRDWLQALRDRCDGVNRLLIFDEVQTGIGRTGNWFAAETFGVRPDVLLFAKGIGSGMPLGGIVAEKSVMDLWPEGVHGSTFGGNPVSCSAALATIDVLEGGNYCALVRERGKQVVERFSQFGASGIGYMIRVPLSNAEECSAVRYLCQEKGLLILSCGPLEDALRIIPALTIDYEDLFLGVSILEKSILEVRHALQH